VRTSNLAINTQVISVPFLSPGVKLPGKSDTLAILCYASYSYACFTGAVRVHSGFLVA